MSLFCPPPTSPASSLFPYTTLFRSGMRSSQALAASPLGFVCGGSTSLVRPACSFVTIALVCSFFSAAALTFDSLGMSRSGEHTAELQSPTYLVCILLLEKKKRRPKQ